MNIFLHAFFFLFVVFGFHSALAYNYFILTLEWPKSYCNTGEVQCISNVPQSFTIHGLSPHYYSGKREGNENCTGPAFNLSKLKSDKTLYNTMKQLWPSFESASNADEDFWKHEWEKYGTCTRFTQNQYFQTTCGLTKALGPLYLKLTKAGIFADNSYVVTNYKTAIESAVNLTPTISCNTDKNKKPQLYQIKFCADRTGTKFQNCTWSPGSCGNYATIAFPK